MLNLPLSPPLDPMLAKLARELPDGRFLFEPKWDGFRCIAFRDGDDIHLQSRNGRNLARYFPELTQPASHTSLLNVLPERIVIDGELVVPTATGLDFDALSNRIHPAASRIERLAADTPAQFIVFDLLAIDNESLINEPFDRRRERLASTGATWPAPLHVTPATLDAGQATDWFHRFEGAGLDGVIAKPLDEPYQPGKRALVKVKQERTADVVVAGFRWHKDGQGVGSLMLGLWDGPVLVHVGVASAFSKTRRHDLVDELAHYRLSSDAQHPWGAGDETPRGANRWNASRDTSWNALEPELVAEVAYEQLTGNRFRHSARFRRWRPDRDAHSCAFAQLYVPPPAEINELFTANRPN
ncbi:MAG: ATP-dependent DNA ligase [Nitriliruptoraceae bacterium]